MPIKYEKDIDYPYGVNGEGMVYLSVDYGFGQLGSAIAWLDDGTEWVQGKPFGNGAQLDGQTLTVVATVSDVSPQTNEVNAIYSLSGGPSPKVFKSKGKVATDGDVALFRAKFRFHIDT